jgi:hypothetical protein
MSGRVWRVLAAALAPVPRLTVPATTVLPTFGDLTAVELAELVAGASMWRAGEVDTGRVCRLVCLSGETIRCERVGEVSTEIERLYEVADDSEADVLDALRIRAGITWDCEPCRWTNVGDNCELCNASRPETTE